ncbi:MAG: type IV conjugative transfer system protein TraE [Geobacteraceae bacterium]
MKLSIFTGKLANIVGENRLLKLAILGIGTAVLVNSMVLVYALNHRTTILVPPVINTKLEIVGNAVPDEYIRVFGRYAMWLALNYSPATARSQFSELLTLFAPERYAEVRKSFYGLADTIEMGHVSSVFHITRIVVDRTKREMDVYGSRRQYANDQLIEDKERVYRIEYRVTDGRFMVVKLMERER